MALADVLGIASLTVSLLGFGFAGWQLKRTADASEATTTAVEETSRRMSLNHLLVLLPQLKSIGADIDVASSENDRLLAIRSLVSYSHTAYQVASLLEREDPDVDTTFITRLRESAKAASAAKSTLVTNKRQTVAVAAKGPPRNK